MIFYGEEGSGRIEVGLHVINPAMVSYFPFLVYSTETGGISIQSLHDMLAVFWLRIRRYEAMNRTRRCQVHENMNYLRMVPYAHGRARRKTTTELPVPAELPIKAPKTPMAGCISLLRSVRNPLRRRRRRARPCAFPQTPLAP